MKLMQKLGAALCAGMMAACCLPLQASAEEATALPSGLTAEELPAKVEQLAADTQYASFETVVFTDTETLYTGYFGEIDRENGIKADADTVYEWGSITKTLTWVSVLQLYEQGKIDLNADIRTYLPDGYLQYLQYDEPITMLHLMNHTAGWCESTYNIFVLNENELTDLGTMLQGIEPAQVFRPGEVQSYSNYGAALAGYIVERVSGESYVDYVRHHIYEPLGMEHTSIAPDYNDNPWVRTQREKLRCYAADLKGELQTSAPDMSYVIPYPAGSACGTISDIVLYAQALMDESAPLFEKPETQAMIFEGSKFFDVEKQYPRCCYGFWPDKKSVWVYSHNGGTMGCYTNMVFDPVGNTGVVVFSNTRTATGVVDGIPQAVFGTPDPASFQTEGDAAVDLTGTYASSRSYWHGFLKWFSCLNVVPVTPMADGNYSVAGLYEIRHVGGDLYLLHSDADSMDMLCAAGTMEDGRKVIRLGAMEYIQDDLAMVKIAAVALLELISIVSLFILLVKLIRLLCKRRYSYRGSVLISAAQGGKVLMTATMIVLLAICGSTGATHPLGMLYCAVNVLCAVLCAAAVVSDVLALVKKSEDNARAWRYILNILWNVFTVACIIGFEMYRFWGI